MQIFILKMPSVFYLAKTKSACLLTAVFSNMDGSGLENLIRQWLKIIFKKLLKIKLIPVKI